MLRLRDYQRASLDALAAAWARGGADAAASGHLVVLPTGAGKALVIAALARETLADNPLARVAIVTHSRELVAQNFSELTRAWPEAPAGIFSAGLGRREADAQVLVCGIQSVADRLDAVGPRDLVIVDEAHLIPRAADTRYGRFLAGLRARTPGMRVAGFTATPYRLDSGRLDEGAHRLFSGIAYEADTFDADPAGLPGAPRLQGDADPARRLGRRPARGRLHPGGAGGRGQPRLDHPRRGGGTRGLRARAPGLARLLRRASRMPRPCATPCGRRAIPARPSRARPPAGSATGSWRRSGPDRSAA